MGFLPLWHVFLLILNLRVDRLLNLRRMLGWHTMAIPPPMDTVDTMAILMVTTMDTADSEEERGLLSNGNINNKTAEAILVDLEGAHAILMVTSDQVTLLVNMLKKPLNYL